MFTTIAPFVGTTVTEIAVLSGKLIASDDLRSTPYFNVNLPGISINSGAGTDAWGKCFAEQAQVAYAFVGNSCPRVTKQRDGSLTMVLLEYDWDAEPAGPVLVDDEAIVAVIDTNLWAVMLADYENWLCHGGAAVDGSTSGYTVIDVTPGLYQWTVFSNDDSFDRDAGGRVEFAKLELIQAY